MMFFKSIVLLLVATKVSGLLLDGDMNNEAVTTQRQEQEEQCGEQSDACMIDNDCCSGLVCPAFECQPRGLFTDDETTDDDGAADDDGAVDDDGAANDDGAVDDDGAANDDVADDDDLFADDDNAADDDDSVGRAPPVTAPVNAPVTAPVNAPVNEPVNAPVTAPVTAPVSAPVNAPVSAPVTAPVNEPVNAPVRAPVNAPVMSPVFFMPPDVPRPPPPEEDPKGEFIMKISNGAQLELIIDDFMAAHPNATLKGTYTSEPYGFSVAGVTEVEIKMFANSCSNLVLDIFKLFQAGNSTGPGGEEGNGCIARPPSGTISMEVVYDAFSYETHFSLWQLNGTNWESMSEYAPPTTFPMDKQVVTVQLEDGVYSFDLVDLAHNGMTGQEMWGYPSGHFKLIETDSGKELYKGAEFGTYATVEFGISNGEAKVTNVKIMNTPMGYFY